MQALVARAATKRHLFVDNFATLSAAGQLLLPTQLHGQAAAVPDTRISKIAGGRAAA